MNITQIEANLSKIGRHISQNSFIYDLLLAYGLPKASITRLRSGNLNLSKNEDEIFWKKQLFFKVELNDDLHEFIDAITKGSELVKHNPRFVIVTDWETLLAADIRTNEKLDIPIKEIAKYYDFFLPWAGLEKTQHQGENPADIKAAERMVKFFDEIKKDNQKKSSEFIHSLNVFLSRLLFCFFAEDTTIFGKNQFTNAIGSHTHSDGEDLSQYLDKLFEVLNTENKHRKKLPAFLEAFPYVNGGLFKGSHKAPKFTRRSRQSILDCGELDWAAINPDIFGSMIQAVVRGDEDDDNTKHYTSVPNIMKVIGPLFLHELYTEFGAAKSNKNKLKALLYRIQKIKIFDPACGSGNFLIIAYKVLRKLEMRIIKAGDMLEFSGISLSNFYGIEIDDFAHEIAMLSLWLAEHQMNMEFFKEFGKTNATLPLKQAGYIVHGNATRLDWEKVCPKVKGDETYILGNPPYASFNDRNEEQKLDMEQALSGIGKIKRLDYIGCWFVKASDYIRNSHSKYAFVSTNSICQGEQPGLLWPVIFLKDQEINFAHNSFVWANNAKGKASVICVIVGVQNKAIGQKTIYTDNMIKKVKSISPYLIHAGQTVMQQRNIPISDFPEMALGSSGIDGGHLILSAEERNQFIKSDSRSEKFIKLFVGGQDFLDSKQRYCLWIEDYEITEALKIKSIKDRVDKCRKFRLTAGRDAKKAADVPHRFVYRKYQNSDAVILPMTSSERRKYIPVGFLKRGAVPSNGVFVIYSPDPYIFGIMSSAMHMSWVRITSGRLKNDFRYSVNLTYNNFPFPTVSSDKKHQIIQSALRVLEVRERYSEKTLAELYDPDNMPKDLRETHHQLDLAIEGCYRSRPFGSDEERLEYLFNLYEAMLVEDANKGGLFAAPQKPAKRKK